MKRSLLHIFSTFATGGPQVRLADLANRLADKYRHIIVAMDGVYDCAEKFDQGVDFELRRPEFTKGATLANIALFHRLLKQWRPDLLLTYNFGAIEWVLANFIGRQPHIHLEDGFGVEESGVIQLPRRVWLRRIGFVFGKHLIVPSKTLHNIAANIWRLPAHKISYIANGVDCERFTKLAVDPEGALFSRTRDEIIIGTLGALRAEKNLPRLVRAFARLDKFPQARLVIAGSGAAGAEAQREVQALGLSDRVTFTGHIAKPERAYSLFDIFAISSDTEQMPLGMLEAMAASLPIASVDAGDITRMLPPENAPFAHGKTEVELAESLAQLCAGAELRKHVGGANARHVRAHFSIDRMCEEYDAMFMRFARKNI